MNRAVRAVTAAAASALAAVAARDLFQRDHALLRNFPLVGNARYLIESVGPELRQYIVAGNNEECPFTRDRRRWVYSSAKNENNYFGFGTDNDIEYTAAVEHPGLIDTGGLPSAADRAEIIRLMSQRISQGGSAKPSPSAAG